MDFRFEIGSIVHFGRGGRYYEVVWRGSLVQGEAGERSRDDCRRRARCGRVQWWRRQRHP